MEKLEMEKGHEGTQEVGGKQCVTKMGNNLCCYPFSPISALSTHH